MIVSDLLTYAKKVNNYIVDATDNDATNLKWDSTTVQEYEVPSDKRWFLLPSLVLLDVSSTLSIYLFDSADKTIAILGTYSAGTGAKPYPMGTSVFGRGVVLDAGEYIKITCGTAQGAGAKASCIVLEIDV